MADQKQEPSERRIYCASDIHLGSWQSDAFRAVQQVTKGVKQATDVVLHGDIFEGTYVPGFKREAVIKRCKDTLTQWAEANPNATIHIIWGNHENPILREGVQPKDITYEMRDEILKHIKEKQLSNVVVHDKGYVRLGDALFLHGNRETEFKDSPKPNFITRVAVQGAHVLKGVTRYYDEEKNKKHIKAIIDTIEQDKAEYSTEAKKGNVKYIVFGHTHDYGKYEREINGNLLTFINTGAAIFASNAMRPVMFEQQNGHTVDVYGGKNPNNKRDIKDYLSR